MNRVILFVGLLLCFSACQQEVPEAETISASTGQEEYYTATFDLSAEGLKTIYELRSRADEPADLYWADIYYKPENSTSTSYPFYGYCIFDTPEAVNIKMLKGYQYNIFVSVIKNGKNIIWKDIQKKYYRYPVASQGEQTLCTNQFVRASSNTAGISAGYSRCYLQGNQNTYSQTEFPDLERYFGHVRDYIPGESGKISIKLYRLYFGLRLEAEGFPQSGGQITVEYVTQTSDGTKTFSLTPGAPVAEWKAQWPYELDRIPEAGEKSGSVMKECKFRVKWTNSDASVKDKIIAEQDIYLERNKMNIIRINLTAPETKAHRFISLFSEDLD